MKLNKILLIFLFFLLFFFSFFIYYDYTDIFFENNSIVDSVGDFNSTLLMGNAIWIYPELSGNKKIVDFINNYNYNVSSNEKIKYVYLSAGQIEASDDDFNGVYAMAYFYDETDFEFFKNNLEGVEIYAMFEVTSETLDLLGTKFKYELSNISKDVAILINNNDFVDGLHYDIEPFNEVAENILISTKNYLDKPLSVAFGKYYEGNFFNFVDIAVLMNYDLCVDDIGVYEKVSDKRSLEFISLCEKYGVMCHYGIASGETFCEKNNLDLYYNISVESYKKSFMNSSKNLGFAFYNLI